MEVMTDYRAVAASGSDSEEYESALETTPMQSQGTSTEHSSDGIKNIPLGLRSERWQNLLSYWILGLTNNFAYVVMLSAAHDILSEDFSVGDFRSLGPTWGGGGLLGGCRVPTVMEPEGNKTPKNETNTTNPRDCNTLSTGTILLADIIPSLIVKILAPFFLLRVHLRVNAVVLLCSAAFLLVGLATSKTMAIFGVICASAGSGLGETTFLSYSANFHRNVVSTWSSGTGGAGVFGSLSYAGLTSVGLSPRSSVLLMLLIPVLMSFSFWILLEHPDHSKCSRNCMTANPHEEEELRILETSTLQPSLSFAQKLRVLPSLLRYMVPVAMVYVAEYIINQGLLELIYFPEDHDWISHHEQYRWYQVVYQVGVLVSRSSVNCITIHHIWKTSALQWLNVVIFLTCAIFWWIKSIWLIFILIFWEGLLGGAAYVNTFYRISHEVDNHHKEFAMGITSLSDTMGVTVAGFCAIPLHNIICDLPL